MTEPDDLGAKIDALKQLERAAWQKLANPLLTTFERREIRNQIKQCDGELRHYLAMMSERTRFRALPIENVGDSLANLNFRILRACQAALAST
jgi:hypothetical protein